jgi:(1->4)-alpha-D-glucan 1-alpha-D-glucosylmutase
MHLPFSTYRIQFNKDFTLEDLKKLLPYLDALGITTIYASPILQAVPGSMHGYDVTSPHQINSEIGTIETLTDIAGWLKKENMGWLQDIVPNHMAFDTHNDQLMDVLERGSLSPYYEYFDINWNHASPELTGKVMVPFLGRELDECLADGEIQLELTPSGFALKYFDTAYPLSIPGYQTIISNCKLLALQNELETVVQQAKALPDMKAWKDFKNEFFGKIHESEEIRDSVTTINGHAVSLRVLLNKMHYTLAFWKITADKINYRRFFTVNSLICLRMENESVFHDYHKLLHALRESGIVQGFRIDHIDGLFDPAGYISRLRNLVGIDTYVVAEKILEEKEGIPEHWDIEGTSGYEFLAYVSQLFTDRNGARKILGFYKRLVPGLPTYKELVLQNKRLILKEHMAGEWRNLVDCFYALNLNKDFSESKISDAIGLLMISLPVYRIYPDSLPLTGEDQAVMTEAFNFARSLESDCAGELNYLESLFMVDQGDSQKAKAILTFARRMMQFTGPLTAKGVEDTTFYIYSPLISHDEVGDSPSRLGISIPHFHHKMIERQKYVPLALNATATHDTKRGEDARIRLNALSELPDEWIEHVEHWIAINQKFITTVGGKAAPEPNELYFIYQSFIGGFPQDFKVTVEFIGRIQAYLTKVIREAKVNSSWEKPDEAYEKACLDFVSGVLEDDDFLKSFIPFAKKIAQSAGIYSLAQALIKITAPGIPDTYQGTELWDLSFVDPDNRRPVDYEARMTLLQQIETKSEEGNDQVLDFALANKDSGAAKLFVTWRTLNFRKRNSDLFIKGDYVPLEVTGDSIAALAFARRYLTDWVIVIIPLNAFTKISGDAKIVLPGNAPSTWRNVFTGERIQPAQYLSVSDTIRKFPVALLTNA